MKQVRFRSLHTGIKFWIDGLWLCIDSWNLIRNKISWLLWWSPQTTFLRIFVPWFDISVSIKHWDFLHDTFGKCHLQILTSNEKKTVWNELNWFDDNPTFPTQHKKRFYQLYHFKDFISTIWMSFHEICVIVICIEDDVWQNIFTKFKEFFE